MKNREIEIKYKVSKEQSNLIEQKLKKNAEFVKDVTQKDTYYNSKHESFIESSGYIYKWLRVRVENGENILTFKDVSSANKGREKIEYETRVDDKDAIKKIITSLNFEILIEYEKKRKVYNLSKDLEISLDFVTSLGYFVEIEYKGDSDSLSEINSLLEQTAEDLGIDSKSEEILGYAHQTLIQKGLTESPI